MSEITREEHIAWIKARALDFLEHDDLPNAVASVIVDLSKHPATCREQLADIARVHEMLYRHDAAWLRRWVESLK